MKLAVITVANIDNPTEVSSWLNSTTINTIFTVAIVSNVFYIFYK